MQQYDIIYTTIFQCTEICSNILQIYFNIQQNIMMYYYI